LLAPLSSCCLTSRQRCHVQVLGCTSSTLLLNQIKHALCQALGSLFTVVVALSCTQAQLFGNCFAALHVDTGRLLPLAQQVPRKQRRWFPCKFGSVDVENHLVFVCSAYCALRGTFIAISWAQAPTLSFFSRLHDLKTIARFLKQFLEHRHTVVAYCLI